MWKYLFEIGDRFFALIPVKKWRDYLRKTVLFDYRRKLNALIKIYPEYNFANMRMGKGGGSIVFIMDNKTTFKVRKHQHESVKFERFEREKLITDALRPYCTIQIPKINFAESDGYVFYISDFIPGKLLVGIPTWKIKKYQDKLSKTLAEFIYKKSFANPEELSGLRGEIKPGYFWSHTDMCSNILVNPKTMDITGIIDWEWARYTEPYDEFEGLVRVRKKMQKIGLDKSVEQCYNQIIAAHQS